MLKGQLIHTNKTCWVNVISTFSFLGFSVLSLSSKQKSSTLMNYRGCCKEQFHSLSEEESLNTIQMLTVHKYWKMLPLILNLHMAAITHVL